jgi:hypothetical protein
LLQEEATDISGDTVGIVLQGYSHWSNRRPRQILNRGVYVVYEEGPTEV